MKDEILNILKEVKRPGIEDLIEFMETSDYFNAPASCNKHLSYDGGLAIHSMNVYLELYAINKKWRITDSWDSIAICGLFHDLCKVNFYGSEIKMVKENGKWTDKRIVIVKDHEPLGHGEKSVMVLQRFIKLTLDEQLAIRWHMGPWQTEDYNGRKAMNSAMDKCKLLKALMLADQMATWLVEA